MLVLIARTAPQQDTAARDLADMALTLAAFGQPLTVLFCGPGVLQLRGHDNDDHPLSSLVDFGIHCAAEQHALTTWLSDTPCPAHVSPLDPDAVRTLLHGASQVWGW
ncbi:DsrE family protein [Isoalcanivorax indicus]|uniref:DsrE family protein n=1 Tax=Isoalcanivorax indicus TaxID=2202653 RepID=UPI000DBA9111|nr:DsrE family protein [Isoalcanivorax indicus]